MPHTAREVSTSGYYHVVPKGIADQILFEDDSDRALYIELLRKAKAQTGLILHAYCLMSNHTHLIVEDSSGCLSAAMKYLHERYAMKFAEQTGRVGGIFRKPYWSEPIKTDNHLLCAVRYVHANPAAAGLCPASAYAWSSARDYLGRKGIADTATVLAMLGGREGFIEWSKASNATAVPFPGSRLKNHLTDEEAARVFKDALGFDATTLNRLKPEERMVPIATAVTRGISIRQLSRVSGLGTSSIQRAIEQGV